jgi:arylsulfatase A-like enzyme
MSSTQPNVVFVFADQWRLQTCGYAGAPDVRTPHIDALAAQSLNLAQATSGWPVCCPYRASLLTGQYPLTHGVFVNDVPIGSDAIGLGQAFSDADYDTAYIGKWHADGHGRSQPIAPERRFGFDYWKVLECTHDYNASAYYEGDSTTKQYWQGYDAFAQTRDAQEYIRARSDDKPFLLALSWGPPHDPYDTAPAAFRALYDPATLQLRPNVPPEMEADARRRLAGYYAHCTALDECIGALLSTLEETGLADNTIFVFTSDHGDMLGSQGAWQKQRPWEESVRVPFLLRYPRRFGAAGRRVDALLNSMDIMPTLLGLCGAAIPDTVEGLDFTPALDGGDDPSGGAALLACFQPFGQYTRQQGGREFRGVRTRRHTYVRALDGPWLLYDNEADPYQMRNLVNAAEYSEVQQTLERELQRKLREQNDEFLAGSVYVRRWRYTVDETGTVPYTQ